MPEEYKKRSAELWPERFTMPVAVATGGRDEVVPPASVLRLAEKLKQAKRPVLVIHRMREDIRPTTRSLREAMEFMLRRSGPQG